MWNCSCGQDNPTSDLTCSRCYNSMPQQRPAPVTTVSLSTRLADFEKASETSKFRAMIYSTIGLSILCCVMSWFLGFNHHSGFRALLGVDLADNFSLPTFKNIYFGKTCNELPNHVPYSVLGWEDVQNTDFKFTYERVDYAIWKGHQLCVEYGPSYIERVYSELNSETGENICPEGYKYCGASECVVIKEGKSADSTLCPITHIDIKSFSECTTEDRAFQRCTSNRLDIFSIEVQRDMMSLPLISLRLNTIAIPIEATTQDSIKTLKVCDRATMSGPLDPTCSLEIPIPIYTPSERPPRPDSHPEYTLISYYGTTDSAKDSTFYFYADNLGEKYAWKDVTPPVDPFLSMLSLNKNTSSDTTTSVQIGFPGLFAKRQTPFLHSVKTPKADADAEADDIHRCSLFMVQELVSDRNHLSGPLSSPVWYVVIAASIVYVIYSFGMVVPSTSSVSIFSAKNSFYGSTFFAVATWTTIFVVLRLCASAASSVFAMVENKCLGPYTQEIMDYDYNRGLAFHTSLVLCLFVIISADLILRYFFYQTYLPDLSCDIQYILLPCCFKRSIEDEDAQEVSLRYVKTADEDDISANLLVNGENVENMQNNPTNFFSLEQNDILDTSMHNVVHNSNWTSVADNTLSTADNHENQNNSSQDVSSKVDEFPIADAVDQVDMDAIDIPNQAMATTEINLNSVNDNDNLITTEEVVPDFTDITPVLKSKSKSKTKTKSKSKNNN